MTRRRTVGRVPVAAVAGVAAVVAVGVGGAVVFAPDGRDRVESQSQQAGSSTPIVQGDLTVSEELGGTLGFGEPGTLFAQAPDTGGTGQGNSGQGGTGQGNTGQGGTAPGGPGTGNNPSGAPSPGPSKKPNSPAPDDGTSGTRIFTGLPKVGDVFRQGETVYHVNGRPVPLFLGDAPLWRALSAGVSDGPDVRLLEKNLVALGFGKDLQVDDKFTAGTEAAVKRWQKALGVPQTGRVDPSAVVVQAGPVRVSALKAAVGAPAQGEVATVSGTGRVVTVPMPVDKQALAKQGDKVSVRLPDGRSTPGTIVSVGTVATKDEGGGAPGGGSPKAVVQVTVTLDKPEDAGTLDGAPVSVGFTSQSRKDVLSVPVNALVALAEGGYAVEVVDGPDAPPKLVAVTPGLFANGRVEVTGEGLAAGRKVRVPS